MGRRRPRDTLRCPGLPVPATVPKPRSPGVIVGINVVEHLSSKCNRRIAGATHEEKDGRRGHCANSGWLSCCRDCLGRKSYGGGAPKRADGNIPNPPVATIPVPASALNGTTSETQMSGIGQVARARELLGKN
jgi:hypothetical protein